MDVGVAGTANGCRGSRDSEWSGFSEVVVCATTQTQGGRTVAVPMELHRWAAPTKTKKDYRTIGPTVTPIYRISEFQTGFATPDFLGSHDSADLNGSASFLTFAELTLLSQQDFNHTTITEYCVIATAPPADYASCPYGNEPAWYPNKTCFCETSIDRLIMHIDVCAPCGATSCGALPCPCPPTTDSEAWQRVWSSNTSLEVVGPGSWCQCAKDKLARSLAFVGSNELHWPPGIGRWYSTPHGGQCAEGTQLGTDGCTWTRLPRARIVYGQQLAARGFQRPQGRSVLGQNVVDEAVHFSNAVIMRAAFTDHPVSSDC